MTAERSHAHQHSNPKSAALSIDPAINQPAESRMGAEVAADSFVQMRGRNGSR